MKEEQRKELISKIEQKLGEASLGAIAPIKEVEKDVRDDIFNHFSAKSDAYAFDEEVIINPQAMNMPTKYTLYIMKRL